MNRDGSSRKKKAKLRGRPVEVQVRKKRGEEGKGRQQRLSVPAKKRAAKINERENVEEQSGGAAQKRKPFQELLFSGVTRKKKKNFGAGEEICFVVDAETKLRKKEVERGISNWKSAEKRLTSSPERDLKKRKARQ